MLMQFPSIMERQCQYGTAMCDTVYAYEVSKHVKTWPCNLGLWASGTFVFLALHFITF